MKKTIRLTLCSYWDRGLIEYARPKNTDGAVRVVKALLHAMVALPVAGLSSRIAFTIAFSASRRASWNGRGVRRVLRWVSCCNYYVHSFDGEKFFIPASQ